MNRNTLLLVALVAVLLAGPLLWLFTDSSLPPPTPGPPAGASPAVSAAAPHGSRPSRSSTRTPAAPATVAVVEAKPTIAEKPADPPPRAVLRVTLDGLDPSIPAADAMVEVSREKSERKGEAKGDRRDADDGVTCSADGGREPTFDVDVSALVPDGTRWIGLQVAVDRAGYLPGVGHATAWGPQRGATQPVIVPVRVTLRPAGFASGVVQDERFARVAFAAIGSFVHTGREWAPVDETRTDAQGEYRLRLVPGEANLVIAVADGIEPGSVQATGVAREDSQLSPFTLRPGLAVSGTIRFPDGRAVPEARIVAMPTWAKSEIVLGMHRLAYRGGRILDAPASALANSGLYRVSGLVPGDYDLGITAPDVSSDLLARLVRRASPPVEGLAFVVDGGRVVIEATSNGRPVPRVGVGIANDAGTGGVAATTDARGVARVLVLPGAKYTIEIGGRGFDPERRSFTGPPIGAEVRLQFMLRRRLPPPTLRLTLRSEDESGDDAVTSADVRLYLDDGSPSALPDASETLAFSQGAAVVSGLWAGVYRVVALPRPDGYRLPAEARASLRDGDETAVELRFAHGGRLHVAVRDAAGKPVAAKFRVLGPDDEEIVPGDIDTDVDPLMRPGKRRVEVTVPGHEPRRLDAVIRPDATTRLDVDLRAGD